MKKFIALFLFAASLFSITARAQTTAGGKATVAGNIQLGPPSFVNPSQSSAYYLPVTQGWSDLGSTTALQPNGTGASGDVCPANNFGGSGYSFDDLCYKLRPAWSSGLIDQTNRRMMFTGGGHTDYCGNEIYTVDIAATTAVHRAWGPSTGGLCGGSEALTSPAGPDSRHTYGGVVNIEHLGLITITAGCLASSSCNRSYGQWEAPFSSFTSGCYAASQSAAGCTVNWTNIAGTQTGTSLTSIVYTDQPACIYYAKTTVLGVNGLPIAPSGNGKEYCWFPNATPPNLLQIDYDLGANTLVGSGLSASFSYAAGIDQANGIMMVGGSGLLYSWNLPGGTNGTDHSSDSGCAALATAGGYISFMYDEVAQQVVAWPGTGQTVYVINDGGSSTGSWTCTAENLGSNTPTASIIGGGGSFGANGRGGYVRLEDAFLMCPTESNGTAGSPPDQVHCWSYRRRPASANSFQTRCNSAGVVECDAMATTADTVPYFGDSGGGVGTGVLDTTTSPPGDGIAGTAKLTVPANKNGADLAGNWNKAWVQGFGQNTDFYVQYRMKMSSAFASYNWASGAGGGGGHKFSIFHYLQASCAGVELTTQDQFQRSYPQMYTDCGANDFNVDLTSCGRSGDFLYEQGSPVDCATDTNTKYNCHRNPSVGTTTSECAVVEAPTASYTDWMTFYYHIHNGTWATAASNINAWFAYSGGNMVPFINMQNQTILCNEYNNMPSDCIGSPDSFNHATLTIYNTGYSGTGNPQASVWYCCMIISTQPIAAPNGPTP